MPGRVEVLGVDPWAAGRDHRARVGLMLQEGGLDLRARPLESIRQHAAFHADPLDPEGLLDELGLRTVADTPYRRLSGGERQRLAFALALIGRPDLLILDEPTAGMDAEARGVVRTRIATERERGAAVLLSSHDFVDVERLADRIDLLAGGRIVASGTADELAAELRPRLQFRLDGVLDEAAVVDLARSVGTAVVADGEPGRYAVEIGAPTPALVAAVAAWCEAHGHLLLELRTAGGSLEDAYLDRLDSVRPA